MRSIPFVLSLVVPVLACSEPDTRVEPAQVNWMEWPAEVIAATPFTVRLVGWGGDCRPEVKLVTTPTVDESAITFEPYFLMPPGPDPCYYVQAALGTAPVDGRSVGVIVAPSFDALATVSGLEASFPRIYEMRAGTAVSAPAALAGFPIRTFGEITVRTATVTTDRINAGGLTIAVRDTRGCVTLRPLGGYPGYIVENPPADTASQRFGFVRGYIYEPVAPVCGETKVFHIVTIN